MIENFNSVQEFLEVIIMEEDDKKVSASLVNFDSIMMQNKLITSTRAG